LAYAVTTSGLRQLSAEVDKFLKLASASFPRVSEVIAAFSDEDRAGAFEVPERRYAQAARDFGCDEPETKCWSFALMRNLRALVLAERAINADLDMFPSGFWHCLALRAWLLSWHRLDRHRLILKLPITAASKQNLLDTLSGPHEDGTPF
jgi:hypothetical protein